MQAKRPVKRDESKEWLRRLVIELGFTGKRRSECLAAIDKLDAKQSSSMRRRVNRRINAATRTALQDLKTSLLVVAGTIDGHLSKQRKRSKREGGEK